VKNVKFEAIVILKKKEIEMIFKSFYNK